jgi:hypothetical protein
MRRLQILLPVLLAPLVLAACGGGGKSAGEIPRAACRSAAFEGNVGLPADFPRPAELTVTNSKLQGPTRVVDGYWESELDEAYREFKAAVEEAGYDVTFDEIEDHDAEVAYKGSGRSGLIALRDQCTEDGVMLVRITNRPE